MGPKARQEVSRQRKRHPTKRIPLEREKRRMAITLAGFDRAKGLSCSFHLLFTFRMPYSHLFLSILAEQSSSALSVVQTVGRVALTLLPMAVLKRSIFQKLIKHLPLSEHPTLATMHQHMNDSIKMINVAVWALLIIPGSLFAATILASMERTPVTGRWRLILLSPEEERSVAADLAGEGWRNEVANILTEGDTEPLPRYVSLFYYISFLWNFLYFAKKIFFFLSIPESSHCLTGELSGYYRPGVIWNLWFHYYKPTIKRYEKSSIN